MSCNLLYDHCSFHNCVKLSKAGGENIVLTSEYNSIRCKVDEVIQRQLETEAGVEPSLKIQCYYLSRQDPYNGRWPIFY